MNAELYAMYQDTNPEKFNKELIYGKTKENVLEAITDALKMAEMVPGVTVENIRYETKENKFTMLKSEIVTTKNVLESRFDKVLFEVYFNTDKDKRGEVIYDEDGATAMVKKPISFFIEKDIDGKKQFYENRKAIYLPKLVDKTFYINNNIRYYPIYQLVSKCAHPIKNGVTIMALSLYKKPATTEYTDIYDEKYALEGYDLKGFHRKTVPLAYFLASKGLEETIKFFYADNLIRVYSVNSVDPPDIDRKYETMFKINKNIVVVVDKKVFGISYYSRVLCMILESLDLTRSDDDIFDISCWKKQLGKQFTTNPLATENKAGMTLLSFERLVDESARKHLYMPDEDRQDTYTLIRWLILNYDEISEIDDSDLTNKRVRVLEYMMFPFRLYMRKQVFRVINTPRLTEAVVKRMFNNIGPYDVCEQMINNDLLRYYNATNEINLYNALLKYTFRGMQSLTRRTSNALRDVRQSYVGRLSLVASSAGDPGTTGTFSPFAKVVDGLFSDKEFCKNWSPSEEERKPTE